jgi:histidyl-tRNA synthetase
MSSKFFGVKGMNDLLSPDIHTWNWVESTARSLMDVFSFEEVRTPIVEDTGLFVRSVGEATEIVGKEMYTFNDKGDRSLTLRPENTAPAARAYIEHNVAQKESVTRWFYLGPMFRYERMKTGRYRQFYQLGAEAYGALDASQDVEIIALAHQLFSRLGIPDLKLHLNSLGDGGTRPQYLEALKAHFAPMESSFPAEAKETFAKNPMRLLDSKDPSLQEAIATAPAIIDFIGDSAKAHFGEVTAMLDSQAIAWQLDRRLVRGLDYYSRTTFEFVYEPTGDNALGTAGTVCGGGRYDGLLAQLGGPEKPAVGFAIGLDRLVLLLQAIQKQPTRGPQLFVGTFDGPSKMTAIALVMQLRQRGFRVDFDPRCGKLKKQLERAAQCNARHFVALGETEFQSGAITVKTMGLADDHPQRNHALPLGQLAEWLASRPA